MSLLGVYKPPTTEAERRLVERLRGHVDMLAGVIGPRHTGKPGVLEAAARYIEAQFAEMGNPMRRETYRAGLADVANLIAERPGAGRQAERIVVVGAHYDSVPMTPGADDNASAVAMLIEVARLLRPMAGRRTMRFVGFTCEEMPHFHGQTMGSQQHAHGCRQRGEKIVGMICLEMVGYYQAAAGQEIPPVIPRFLRWAFPRRGDFLAAAGNLRSIPLVWRFRQGFRRAASFPLYAIALPELVHEIRLSDNSSFWDYGYPAVMVTDTSFLRNPHYHQPSDAPETLDYERLAVATVGVAGAVGRLAGCRGRVAAV